MLVEEFWELVELARVDASTGEGLPSGTAIGQVLAARLEQLPPERILEFHLCSERVRARADQWSLCAAMSVICGYVSDDSFSDFKAGLVGLGRAAFEQAVVDADSLADHPMVLAVAAGQVDRFAMLGEAIGYAASSAFTQHCGGDSEAFWQALEDHPVVGPDGEEHPTGDLWSGGFGSAEDAALIPSRLPMLLELFPRRASGGR